MRGMRGRTRRCHRRTPPGNGDAEATTRRPLHNPRLRHSCIWALGSPPLKTGTANEARAHSTACSGGDTRKAGLSFPFPSGEHPINTTPLQALALIACPCRAGLQTNPNPRRSSFPGREWGRQEAPVWGRRPTWRRALAPPISGGAARGAKGSPRARQREVHLGKKHPGGNKPLPAARRRNPRRREPYRRHTQTNLPTTRGGAGEERGQASASTRDPRRCSQGPSSTHTTPAIQHNTRRLTGCVARARQFRRRLPLAGSPARSRSAAKKNSRRPSLHPEGLAPKLAGSRPEGQRSLRGGRSAGAANAGRAGNHPNAPNSRVAKKKVQAQTQQTRKTKPRQERARQRQCSGKQATNSHL